VPTQPPRFRPPGWREPKPWQRPARHQDKRKRGRAGQRDRKQVLDEEPFCRLCLERGLYVASDVVDHIVNLAAGGSDDRANKQGLCDPCHDAKTREEARRGRLNDA
jgi:5-methylcytosine-specific restriction protein A